MPFATVLAAALAAAPASESVFALDKPAFTQSAKQDLTMLQRHVKAMQAVVDRLAQRPELFQQKRDVLKPEDKQLLLSAWGSLFAYFSATEGLRQRYWNFVTLPPTDERHAWGFVVTHAALTAILANGLRFASLAAGNPQLETILDEENGEAGVPKGAFGQLKLKAIHVATTTQLITGDVWAKTALPLMKRLKLLDATAQWAADTMAKNGSEARSQLLKRGVTLYAGNAADIAKDTTRQAIFPVQKGLAEWAGDTRVARNGKPLITREQIVQDVLPKLRPGDVIVVRQNWFLSNIGLPGFWPHAELYAGSAKDLEAAFDQDPAVIAWAKAQPEKAATFTELLAKRYPQKWKAYATGTDFQGHGPVVVIESISEGVSFTAIEHAFGVDYLGALRPRLPPLEKAQAIERAFKYQGRPYDFDFDFFSDSTLVCTELVYKAYQPGGGLKGLTVELADVAGRRTLPANDLVKRFDAEGSAETRQFDFVVFVEGHEHERTAKLADEAAFRSTWRRVKWDVAQQ